MNDKYSQMPVRKAHIDFSAPVRKMDFKGHSAGIGGVGPQPMTGKMIEGTARLKPDLIRIFIQEFFFIEKPDGALDFSALDAYMESISKTGADIMASICIKPPSLYPAVDETVWRPADAGRWRHIIGEMAKRYSIDNKFVTHWGVGNEINIGEYGGCPYKIESPDDYFEYYKMTVEPILEVFPEARVGGPSWAGVPNERNREFFERFIGACKKENVQLDFISYNVYSDSPEHHTKGALTAKDIVDGFGGGIEIYVTELNVGIGNEISIEEKSHTPKRAAGLAAILCDFHKRAGFLKTFQYHLYDQFCDPNDFKPFYARARYMANHWSDEPHRLGLLDERGAPKPQYFVYSMLYSMAENEVAANAEGCEDLKLLASYGDRRATVFMANYNVQSACDFILTLCFKDAPEGRAKLSVYRIDVDRKWDADIFELIPNECRTVYAHSDFSFSVYMPADCVAMATLEYI